MKKLIPLNGIVDISPYRGGNEELLGCSDTFINLASNESTIGPSAKAIEAYKLASIELHRYPDGSATILRNAISKRHKLDPGRIVCGAGSDELIGLLVRSYAGPGHEVLYSQYGFLMYSILAKAAGANPVVARESNFRTNVEEIIANITPRTRVVLIANPNNPTGSYLTALELEFLCRELPDYILLVIDSAYAEFVIEKDYDAGSSLVDRHNNVVMTRTFSKLYGLAALRIGWCYSSLEIAGVLNKVRAPFNIGTAAQAAASAAISDLCHEQTVRESNTECLPLLRNGLRSLGLEPLPSVANFVLAGFSNPEEAISVKKELRENDILVRDVSSYGLPQFLRITVGQKMEIRKVLRQLSTIFDGRVL